MLYHHSIQVWQRSALKKKITDDVTKNTLLLDDVIMLFWQFLQFESFITSLEIKARCNNCFLIQAFSPGNRTPCLVFHEFDFKTSESNFEVSKPSIWKHTTLCEKRVFFFHHYLANSTTNWAQIFTGLLFYVYVEIHKVRRLVFDNYQ